MPPSSVSTDYLPNLTGLRGVAATWVLILHAWQFSGRPELQLTVDVFELDLTPLVQCGYFGVDLFFVLSGFLLSTPFHRAAAERRALPSLKRFWAHRCRRVLPAYWVQLAILATVYASLGQVAEVQPRNVLAQALLIMNVVPWHVPLLNPVSWSMPPEWDFYVVMPLLALLLANCRWWLALTAILIWVVSFRLVCYLSWFDIELARYVSYAGVHQLPGRLDQFFVGVLAAWIAVRRAAWMQHARLFLLAGLGGIVAMAYAAGPRGDFLARFDVPWLFFHHSLVAAGFGLVTLGAAGDTRLGTRLFAAVPLTFLGLISYSLYLWHYPALQLAQVLGLLDGTRAPAWLVVLGACIPVIALVAWISYRYVELPFFITAPAAQSYGANRSTIP